MSDRILVVGAAIVDDLSRPQRLLAARRTEPPHMAGGWELPGGKVDPGETPIEALHREIREELDVEIDLGERVTGPLAQGTWSLGPVAHMLVHLAQVRRDADGRVGIPRPVEGHDALRWLARDDLDDVKWLPADLPIVAAIAPLLSAGPWSEAPPRR